jgi:hypothetical protein
MSRLLIATLLWLAAGAAEAVVVVVTGQATGSREEVKQPREAALNDAFSQPRKRWG